MTHPTPTINQLREDVHKTHSWQWIFVFIPVTLVLLVSAHLASQYFIHKQDKNLNDEWVSRLSIMADNHAALVHSWLKSIEKNSSKITKNPQFQIFVQQLTQQDAQMPPALQAQTPYMTEVLNSYIRNNHHQSAHVFSSQGKMLFSSVNAGRVPQEVQNLRNDALANTTTLFSKIYSKEGVLVVSSVQAIQTLQGEKNIAVLITTTPVKTALKNALKSHFFNKGEVASLIQASDQELHKINVEVGSLDILNSLEDEKNISTHVDIVGTQFTILQSIPIQTLSRISHEERFKIQVISYLAAGFIIVLMVSFWWHQKETKEHALLEQYQKLAEHINTQRKLLNNINEAVKEQITLKDLNGKYTYTNPAFSQNFSLLPEEIIGLDDNQLYGNKVAEQFKIYDDRILTTAEPIHVEQTISLGGEIRHLEISKTPYLDQSHHVQGIVTVTRDISDIVSERTEKERAQKNSIRAFSRIMQQHDPYLHKHSNLVHKLAIRIADDLGLKDQDKQTINIVSQLWQIGKIFVPLSILEKKKRSQAEEIEYRTHVEKSAFILDTIDWGLPIVNTLYHVYEHLDGSGYPNNVKGKDIPELSKLMAVCHTFAEAISPRAHTEHKTPEEALEFLIDHAHLYEIRYVKVLEKLIEDDPAIIMSA